MGGSVADELLMWPMLWTCETWYDVHRTPLLIWTATEIKHDINTTPNRILPGLPSILDLVNARIREVWYPIIFVNTHHLGPPSKIPLAHACFKRETCLVLIPRQKSFEIEYLVENTHSETAPRPSQSLGCIGPGTQSHYGMVSTFSVICPDRRKRNRRILRLTDLS